MRALLLALTLLPGCAQALEQDISNALQTVGGLYSSIYIHEFGHALAFSAFGATDITIEVPQKGQILGGLTTAHFPAPLSASQRQVSAASGLLATMLAGEVVLQRQGLHHSPYAQAVLGTAVISNLRHTYTYYTRVVGRDGYTGNDIDSFAQAGGNPHLFSAALVTYAAWTLHRMRKEGIPLFYVDLHF
jgi:hypothetical protein